MIAALALGTGASPDEWHSYSFWVDGLDLTDYMDHTSLRIDMTALASDNSRASFRIINYDGSLDFDDYWGIADPYLGCSVAYPLRHVQVHDHERDVPLFGGYVMSMRMGLLAPNRSYIDLDCVGYSLFLDASWTREDLAFDAGTDLYTAVQSVLGQGIHGDLTWAAGTFDVIGGDPSVSNVGTLGEPAAITAGTTFRQAIIALAGASNVGIGLWVDNYRRVCVLPDNWWVTGPVTTYGTGTLLGPGYYDPEHVEVTFDFSEYSRNIYIDSATADGRGWYEGRQVGTGYGPPQGVHTYDPIPIDSTVTMDSSTAPAEVITFGRWHLAEKQSRAYATVAITTTGPYPWFLGYKVKFGYPQLTSVDAVYVLTGFALTIPPGKENQDHRYEMRWQTPYAWGIGGYTSTTSTGMTSAEWLKSRMTVRTS